MPADVAAPGEFRDHVAMAWLGNRALKKIAGRAVRLADPSQVVVPGNLVDHLAQRWILLHKYFSALAHGSTKEIHRFEDNLHEVEQMVLVMFGPRPSESLAAIDAILAEERSDA